MGLDVFSPAVDIIGTAKLVASIAIVTLKCVCPQHQVLMGQMGLPIECPTCKKIWFVSATMKINVAEVHADLNKLAAAIS